jgi:hypothetical protein
MYHLLRHRRLWLVLVFAVLLLFCSDIQSWAGTRDQESYLFEDAGLDALFSSTEQLSQLHTGERYAHQHSIKWTNTDEIPDTQVFAHVPGKW